MLENGGHSHIQQDEVDFTDLDIKGTTCVEANIELSYSEF